MDITATLALNNGVHIPVLGLGTWLSEPGEVKVAVEFALKQGYKHVDCAAIYFNEKVPHTNMMWDVGCASTDYRKNLDRLLEGALLY